MRDHSQHIEMSRDDAVSAMLEAIERFGFGNPSSVPVDKVSLDSSYGRILAQDVFAKTDIPNKLTCCLDSVAVRWDDFKELADEEVPDTSDWVRGEKWQFANTGIAMPDGFDTAVVIEHVEVSDDERHVTIKVAPTERFAGTRAAGSKMQKGDLAVRSGQQIDADTAANISSAGYSTVVVKARPRVAFIPTGNELVPPNLPFAESAHNSYAGFGHVFESNSFLVKGKVEAWGGVYVPFDIVQDEYEAIKDALLEASKVSDIIVLNAGSSKGSDDWSVEVLEEYGQIICHQVAHGPGHHSFYGIIENTPVVGISGPPGGASFTLGFYLRPIIRKWLGLDTKPKTLNAVLDGSFGENKFAKAQGKISGEKRPPEASERGSKFWSVRFMDLSVDETGRILATPVKGKAGSPSTQHAEALYLLESASDSVFPKPGEVITVELRS